MNLFLKREASTQKSTPGKLWVNGREFCETLEDVVRPVKIYGMTAIPAGTYKVVLTKSPRFGRVLPLLLDVPNFEGVRIHPGNRAEDTEGCILVGRTRGADYLYQSKAAFADLFALLETAKTPIVLEIKAAR